MNQPAIGLLDTLNEIDREERNARARGRTAYHNGLGFDDNPHMRGSLQHEHWGYGWRDGELEVRIHSQPSEFIEEPELG